MRIPPLCLGMALAFAVSSPVVGAQGDADAAGQANTAIRESADAFVAAFNKHDAQKLAAMWTENGEYIDENGTRYAGRKAIENEYKKFFESLPEAKIQITVNSVRLLNDNTAIEEGVSSLKPLPPGAPAMSKYTTVHVKQDDGWRIASVRDTRVEISSTYGRLQGLEWLVGKWHAEHEGVTAHIDCQWVAGKSFLQRRFTIAKNGQTISSSVEIIGWDPLRNSIASWSFSSGGARSEGVWVEDDGALVVEHMSVTSDGTQTSDVTVWSSLAGGAIGWRSVGRTIDGQSALAAREVVLKRAE